MSLLQSTRLVIHRTADHKTNCCWLDHKVVPDRKRCRRLKRGREMATEKRIRANHLELACNFRGRSYWRLHIDFGY
jgi:hypothetical protein